MCVWNKLPEKVIQTETIKTFKRHLDGYLDRKDLEGFGGNQAQASGNLISMDELGQRACFHAM